MKYFLAVFLVASFCSSAFAKAITYDCIYNIYASTEGVKKESYKSTFVLDDLTNKAVLIGSLGMSDVKVVKGEKAITFLEVLETGAVQSTTIISKTGDSVASRHTVIAGELSPSQYYGTCAHE